MKPDRGEEGIYALCVGPAVRGLTAHAPYPHSGPIYAETNAFWEVKLAASPEKVLLHASLKAQEVIRQACEALDGLKHSDPAYAPLNDLMEQSQQEFQAGRAAQAEAKDCSGTPAIYKISKALRGFTRAQVRALQVSQALQLNYERSE